jgi:hypothetical protein
MDISKLSITFNRGYHKEYFRVPDSLFLNYSAWNPEQANGLFPPVKFHKKDPTALIMLKDTSDGEFWLYMKDNKLVFQKIRCIKYGFGAQEQPLMFWVEYPKEWHFILYATTGFGVTEKYFLIYFESGNDIYMKFTHDISKATLFSFGPDQ